MPSVLRSGGGVLLAASLLAAVLGAPGRVEAASDVTACRRAVLKGVAKLAKARTKALQKCEDTKLKGKGDTLVPPDAACTSDSKTAARIAKAESKLASGIGRRCGGPDRACGTADDDLDVQLDLGFGASCPNLGGGPCGAPLAHCGDVASCLGCIAASAADQAVALAYGALALESPTLLACQRALGKETARYALVRAKLLAACHDARVKGQHGDACPDAGAAPGSPAEKAAAKIAKATSKAISKICRRCGGPDRGCDAPIGPVAGTGGTDDPAPAAIGFKPHCDVVTVPSTAVACGGPVTTLGELVACVVCVGDFLTDCAGAAPVPALTPYPGACNPSPTITPTPTVTVTPTPHANITEIIDAGGDGGGRPLAGPEGLAVDAAGNVYVAGHTSDNAFKITPGGVITEIIDTTGDGAGNPLDGPWGIAVDALGNVYVAGRDSDNAFKITPAGAITEIIDTSGDGAGAILDGPRGIAVDLAGNVYVPGRASSNVFKITPAGAITEIIDSSGDGAGTVHVCPWGVAVDAAGTVYVACGDTESCVAQPGAAFSITPGGTITAIIDIDGDGMGRQLRTGFGIALDGLGDVYVVGNFSSNVFRVDPGVASEEIINVVGDGTNQLAFPRWVAADASGTAYVTGQLTHNAFAITAGGLVTQIIDATGDGAGNGLQLPRGIAVDGAGAVYVAGFGTDNVFRIAP